MGNILKLNRWAQNGIMDSLNYNYYAGKNQLSSVRDVVASAAFSNDIDNQPPNNYIYDLTGNLIYDASEKIKIKWTHYGKIKQIDSTAGTTKLKFKYDATGNRLVKENIKTNSKEIYVRDAQGHVIALYTIKNDSLYLSEMYMYGSQRLGYTDENIFLAKKNSIFPTGNFSTLKKVSSPKNVNYTFGNKRYEINDWLGNVRAVITDKKIPDSHSGNLITSYKAEVVSVTDYYPFGMEIAERSYELIKPFYRFGFNTQEHIFELNKDHYTAKFWEYDARTGRRWNRDPKPTANESEYAVNKNNPVNNSDPEGDCPTCSTSVQGSLTIGLGNKGRASFSFGLSAGLSYTSGSLMLGAQASGRLYAGTLGSTGLNDVQGDLTLSPSLTLGGGSAAPMALNTFNSQTPSAISNSFHTSGTLASNLVLNTSGRNQRVGNISFRAGDVSGNIYNDVFPVLGDKNDRWWTGGGQATIGNTTFGTEVFTGERIADPSLAKGEFNSVNAGNNTYETRYLTSVIGNRAYYNQSARGSALTNGQTFLQVNTSNGLMIGANFSGVGLINPMYSQNAIHDNFPFGKIPRFLSTIPQSSQGILGMTR